ncbi:MAG: sugar transferase [Clostridiales Family XIII bacterium]|jgi:lipopolysaccharide/colanic/teichoic acid biosynthesis glycosyltransferase|nr:sugar transferase [Clostridiales Family XIII bacterium]
MDIIQLVPTRDINLQSICNEDYHHPYEKPIYYAVVKRLSDIILSGTALILLAPFFLLVILLIRRDGGAAIYSQERLRRYGKPFKCYKFRSMILGADDILKDNKVLWEKYVANGNKLPPGEDPRITKIGKLLRQTSLDELPQLWNIFRGDMALVGPRPILPFEIHEYAGREQILFSMRPGLTGWWQVNGRSKILYPERGNLQCDYIFFANIRWDIKIILMTVRSVLLAKDAW